MFKTHVVVVAYRYTSSQAPKLRPRKWHYQDNGPAMHVGDIKVQSIGLLEPLVRKYDHDAALHDVLTRMSRLVEACDQLNFNSEECIYDGTHSEVADQIYWDDMRDELEIAQDILKEYGEDDDENKA